MGKIIKKFIKIIGWMILVIILLVITLSILINTPRVQNYITQKAFGKIEEKFGNHIFYNSVRLSLFNKAEFTDLLITDLEDDTIIFATKFKAGFPGLIRKVLLKKEIPVSIGNITFEDTYFRLYSEENKSNNIQFIIDIIKTIKDTTKAPEPVFIGKLSIKDSKFRVYSSDTTKSNSLVDFNNMIFSDLNIEGRKIRIFSDTIDLDFKSFSCTHNSGLIIDDLTSKLRICGNFMDFKDLDIKTENSVLEFQKLNFSFDQFKDFSGGNFFSKVKLKIDCSYSSILMHDIGYFSNILIGVNQRFNMSGNFYGYVSNLKGKNFKMTFGKSSQLMGNFDISGLPDAGSTFLIFDFKELITNTSDLNSLKLPKNKKINLPSRFASIQKIKYKGNFTGFFQDFVSYGTIETNLGILKTDILFHPESNDKVSFSGNLKAKDFNIGAITPNPDKIGNISLNITLDGLGRADEGFEMDVAGEISNFYVNGYDYKNITVDGNFAEDRFNGKLNIEDPNARVDFNGLLDFSSEIRQYNFSANVLHTNLYALNINTTDSNYTTSFLLNADIQGNNIDNLNGKVKLINSLFTNSDAQIQVYDLQLEVINDSLENRMMLQSDFLDGEISGHYKLSQLHQEYLHLINRYLPAFPIKNKKDSLDSSCSFNYNLSFKNCMPFFAFFTPEYNAMPKTFVKGTLIRNGKIASSVHIESPQVNIKNTEIHDLVLNTKSDEDTLIIDIGTSMLSQSDRLVLENFSTDLVVDSNFTKFHCRWINWDSTLSKGNISGDLTFLNNHGEKLRTSINIDHSILVLNDSLWHVNAFSVLLDTNRIKIDGFELKHKKEFLAANGALSDDNIADSLFCNFNDFNFGNLNYFTKSESIRFGGIFNGEAVIAGLKKPLFFATVFVKDLELNNNIIGDTYINTHWENDRQAIAIDADVMRGALNTLNIRGDFLTSTNEFDLSLNLDKFRMEFLNPYVDLIFDDIRGNATGVLSLTGKTSDPKLNGELKLQKAALTVDYLQTRYNFTSVIGISNNNLVFDNLVLNDEFGNMATLNGIIQTDFFKNFNLNLSIDAKKFMCLKTKEKDNEMFFGTAFTTGLVRITGAQSTLKFDVTASTEAGTEINIPLSDSDELSDYDFIKYIGSDSASRTEEKDDYKVNLEGMQMDFKLKLTPEAKIKIIFDPTMGDIIEGKGQGDMRIAINTLGDFKIIGDYVIESGDYLFTLKNVIANKKFEVKKGSTLRWSGDPINADVNIDSYYEVNTSLNQLIPEMESSSTKKVHCLFGLKGKLLTPDISYDIELPYAEQQLRDKVASRINSEEEKGKQFLSLLLMNSFLPSSGSDGKSSGIEGGNLAGVNASELLSNQLSNWLSQISNDFDIGFNYRPNTELSPQQVEVALSTQLLNDRLVLNGSVDMKNNAEANEANSFVGDVDIDYKITENGKVRARAFNRANEDEQVVSFTPYTQGVGVFYTEEFDKLGEVIKRYKEKLFGNRENKKDKNGKDESKSNEKEEDTENIQNSEAVTPDDNMEIIEGD